MNYIVFDLEWNQCPDGKAKENPALPFEIVEIGAIKLNSGRQEVSRFHELVQPSVYKRMHPMTKSIIHITPGELKSADLFPAVCQRFLQWCGPDAVYCIWGSLDLLELQRNMRFHHMDTVSVLMTARAASHWRLPWMNFRCLSPSPSMRHFQTLTILLRF